MADRARRGSDDPGSPEHLEAARRGDRRAIEAILREHGHDGGESLLHLLTRSPAFRDPRYRNLAMQLGFDQLLIPSH